MFQWSIYQYPIELIFLQDASDYYLKIVNGFDNYDPEWAQHNPSARNLYSLLYE